MQPRPPSPRIIRSQRDAEKAAFDWMVYFGYADAQLCRGGPDAGIDISSTDAVAQVKAGETPTGRPVVQQLSGIAGQVGKRPVLFTVSGVTDEAREWADKAGIAL